MQSLEDIGLQRYEISNFARKVSSFLYTSFSYVVLCSWARVVKANITSVIGEEATILVVDQVHAHIIMWGILLLSCGLEIKINFLSFFFDVRMCLHRSSLKVNVERGIHLPLASTPCIVGRLGPGAGWAGLC